MQTGAANKERKRLFKDQICDHGGKERKKKKKEKDLVSGEKNTFWEKRTMEILVKQKETNGPSRIYCGWMWIYSVQKTTHLEVD